MSNRMNRSQIIDELLETEDFDEEKEKKFMIALTYKHQTDLFNFMKRVMQIKRPDSIGQGRKIDKIRAIYRAYHNNRIVPAEFFATNKVPDKELPPQHTQMKSVAQPLPGQMNDEAVKQLKEEADKILLALAKFASSAKKSLDEHINEAIERESKKFNKVEIHIKSPGQKTRVLKDKIYPSYFEHLLELASARVNIMLVGPTGCGKTHVVGLLAEALGLRYSSISCSVGMTESKLEGWLLPTGKAGAFEYSMAQFVDMYENGGIFLLDEIDASDPNTTVFINQAIAQDHFFLPKRIDKPKVKKHKDFILVAAANTFGNGADMMFVGRNQLDAATLDRFRAGMVTVDYDERIEKKLIDPKVYEWGINIRNRIYKHKLRRAMSTRTMIEFTKLHKMFNHGPEKWEQSYFADWTGEERSRALS